MECSSRLLTKLFYMHAHILSCLSDLIGNVIKKQAGNLFEFI